ncbi:hypothetical protein P8610_04410 [Fictibacillus sp. UD]|uniref:hypothetical protein n=1 Tax=Fictibacillus sp. UD TaxID=3038777 RepID=UPI00374779C2
MKKKLFYGCGLFVLSFLATFLILHSYVKITTPNEHEEWIQKKGWNIAFYIPKKEKFTVPEYPEALRTYSLANVHFNGYKDKKITQYRYRLKESCNKEYLEAVILTVEEKMLGSYIDVSDSKPGVTEMVDKDMYMNEVCLY